MSKNVLIAIDGSPQAEKALFWAINEINVDSKFYVVYVISSTKYGTLDGIAGYDGIQTIQEIRERIINDEKMNLSSRVKEISISSGINIEFLIKAGDPRSEIIKAADEIKADSIVLGSTGKGIGTKLLLGSISEYVVTHAKITATVVR